MNLRSALVCLLLLGTPVTAMSAVVTEVKKLMPSAALTIANKALLTCRDKGYQVAVVVVDRNAIPQVMLRDIYASRFTIEIAERKANAVILGGVSTKDMAANRADITDRLNLVEGILILEGGLPISAGGALVGAIGVSGAPGGHLDAQCARAGIKEVEEELEFAD